MAVSQWQGICFTCRSSRFYLHHYHLKRWGIKWCERPYPYNFFLLRHWHLCSSKWYIQRTASHQVQFMFCTQKSTPGEKSPRNLSILPFVHPSQFFKIKTVVQCYLLYLCSVSRIDTLQEPIGGTYISLCLPHIMPPAWVLSFKHKVSSTWDGTRFVFILILI